MARPGRAVAGAMKLVVALAPLALLAACAAAPRPVAALQPPVDGLAFYVGHWTCYGTSYPSADDPHAQRWDARVEVEPELDGHSLAVRMIGPGANRTVEHKGYDPTTKRWYHVAIVNDGSWIAMTSPGWDGDHMVFAPVGPADDGTRATFTRLGARRYRHAESRVTPAGEQVVWEKVCTR